jgi:hypothetical protein
MALEYIQHNTTELRRCDKDTLSKQLKNSQENIEQCDLSLAAEG